MFDVGESAGTTGRDLALRFGGIGKPLSQKEVEAFLKASLPTLALAVFCYSDSSIWGPRHHPLLILSSLDDVSSVERMGLGDFSYFLISREDISANTRHAFWDYWLPGTDEIVG